MHTVRFSVKVCTHAGLCTREKDSQEEGEELSHTGVLGGVGSFLGLNKTRIMRDENTQATHTVLLPSGLRSLWEVPSPAPRAIRAKYLKCRTRPPKHSNNEMKHNVNILMSTKEFHIIK